MSYQEIQALGLPNSPRKLGLYEKPWACISWYGPCTQLVNSKYSLFSVRSKYWNVAQLVSLSSGAYNLKTIKSRYNLKTDLDRAKVGYSSDMIFVSLAKLFNRNSKF